MILQACFKSIHIHSRIISSSWAPSSGLGLCQDPPKSYAGDPSRKHAPLRERMAQMGFNAF